MAIGIGECWRFFPFRSPYGERLNEDTGNGRDGALARQVGLSQRLKPQPHHHHCGQVVQTPPPPQLGGVGACNNQLRVGLVRQSVACPLDALPCAIVTL